MLTRFVTALGRAPKSQADMDGKQHKWLFLLPHEDDPDNGFSLSDDLDPPLGAAAANDLTVVAQYMTGAEYVPEIILSSRTRRARDMVDFIAAKLNREPVLWTERAIHYGATAEMIDSLRAVKDSVKAVLVITGARRLAHLALKLSRGYGPYTARAARHRMLADFPAGSFAALCLATERWSDLAPKAGLVHAFVRPSDLRPKDH